jgi:hypothetical protein
MFLVMDYKSSLYPSDAIYFVHFAPMIPSLDTFRIGIYDGQEGWEL